MRGHREGGDRHVTVRCGVRRTDRQPVGSEHTGRLPQQARAVGRDHGHLGSVQHDAGLAGGGERDLLGAQRERGGRGLAAQRRGDPPHKLAHQAGLPVVPRGRAGGLSVGDRQRVEQVQQRPAPDSLRDLRDRHRVVEVTPGSRARQQQMLAYRPGDQAGVASSEPQPVRGVPRHHLAGQQVVTGPALADVVQQRDDQQQVRPGHGPGQRSGVGRRLDQVPVHGVGVQRVALRAVAHPLPVRQQTGDEFLLVQSLPDADRGLAGAEQRKQCVPCAGGPGDWQRRAVGQPGQRPRGQGEPRLGGRCRRPQRQRRVTGRVGGPGEHHVAVLLDQALGQWAAKGADGGNTAPGQPSAGQAETGSSRPGAPSPAQPGRPACPACPASAAAVGLPERLVERVGDGAPGLREAAQQRVGVGQAEHPGHLVLFLQHQPVGRAAGHHVQRMPGIEDELPPGADARPRP